MPAIRRNRPASNAPNVCKRRRAEEIFISRSKSNAGRGKRSARPNLTIGAKQMKVKMREGKKTKMKINGNALRLQRPRLFHRVPANVSSLTFAVGVWHASVHREG
uniref:Uncharacterized protein n=1 Tax=Anopheles atroparvus TaxID=41427 RepID=A0AAG5DGW7_ANOAO